MAANSPSDSKPSNDNTPAASGDANYVPLTLADTLNLLWKKHGMLVLGLCVLVLIGIIGYGAWGYHQHSVDEEVGAAFAAAQTTDQLRAFVSAHPDHSLAGIAELRIADEAYAAGKSAEALAAYERALAIIKTGPIAARIQLGRGLTKVQAGKVGEGITDLKQLVGDATQFKAARVEAAYQLASLAADAGNAADVQRYVDQLTQIDPTSPWAQRGMMLRATLPSPTMTMPIALPATTSSTAGPTTKKEDGGPSVQLKLPSK